MYTRNIRLIKQKEVTYKLEGFLSFIFIPKRLSKYLRFLRSCIIGPSTVFFCYVCSCVQFSSQHGVYHLGTTAKAQGLQAVLANMAVLLNIHSPSREKHIAPSEVPNSFLPGTGDG